MEEPKIIELAVAFLSGILITLTGALLSRYFQNRTDKSKKKEAARFKVYMNLLEIHSNYFWVFTAELHNEEVRAEVKHRLNEVAWKTADLLRENDGLEYHDEIMDFLFNEGITTARERYQLIQSITDKLSKLVNPKYTQKINKITSENMDSIAERGIKKSNAPASHNL
ncbi:hypothetical protein [Ekhidna sp.]|uniref:hypothetical protein n=1 Tax=Ekhidna sp. TaxID=2608089 RepID=UPI003297341E